MHRDRFRKAREKVKQGLHLSYDDLAGLSNAKGEVFIRVLDRNDEVIDERHVPNVITSDASILGAILFRDPSSRTRGIYMLAVGTGATGSLLSPDAPDPAQRKLNAEIARKGFSTTTFRDASGNAVAIPTNVVDFTTVFDEGEAVGALNEMGLISPISDNPLTTNPNPDSYPTRDLTRDLTLYDILVNYLTFAVLSIPATARLSLTWRITF